VCDINGGNIPPPPAIEIREMEDDAFRDGPNHKAVYQVSAIFRGKAKVESKQHRTDAGTNENREFNRPDK
jgi:hypothetical protein